MFTRVLGHYVVPQFSTQTFRRALTASVDSCAEIKELKPLQWRNQFRQSRRKVPESDARSVARASFTNLRGTPHASLSGTFLQTLPEQVTLLKGHSLSPRSCPPTLSAPSERSEY